MPFKSEKQRRFLYAKHPEVAAGFARKEKDMDHAKHKKPKGMPPKKMPMKKHMMPDMPPKGMKGGPVGFQRKSK